MKYKFKIQYGSGNSSNTNIFDIKEGTLIKVLDKNITEVIIPNSVTTIGDHAFGGIRTLTNVQIGDSVETIGDYAFFNTDLRQVDIPDSVITIGERAFSRCSSLTSVRIGDSVETIGDGAFENTHLTNVVIPDSVRTIGYIAFSRCSSLTSVRIGDSVETIGDHAFFYTDIKQVDIPDSVRTIGNSAFRRSGLTEIIIPDNVTTIGDYAFYNTDLRQVDIPDSVTTIGEGTFGGIRTLRNVQIGDSVETIGDYAFFNTDLRQVDIPDSVRTIGNSAFRRSGLTEIIIPDNVTTIGDYAFYETYLRQVDIPDNVTTIGERAFEEIRTLTDVTIGNSVRTIGNSAFRRSGLTEIIIPNNVTTIGDYAFYETYLIQVDIPDSVITIGERAFSRCSSLTSVRIGDSVETIGDGAFENTHLTNVVIPDSVITIGDRAFVGISTLTNVQIGDSVETIGDYAFYNTNLRQIDIPDSVRTIGNNAFPVQLSPIDELLERLGEYDRKETFEINRNFVYDSIYKNYEIFNNDIFVKFSGEAGIDCGGLKNDFFNLLSKYIFNNFMEEDNNYCIIKNDNNYEVENYYYIGKLFAYAIKVRANIEIRLHPLLLHMLINSKSTDVEINHDKTSLYKLNQLPGILQDINIQEKIQYELDYQYHWNNLEYDIDRIRTILNDYDSQLLEEGIISSSLNLINTKKEDWTYLVNTLCLDELDYICENNSENEIEIPYENRELLVELKIKSYLYNKKFEETTAFIEGFHSIINPTLLEDISMKDLNLLIAGNNNIEVNLFLDNLEFENVNDEQLNLIKNIITEYAEEDNNYLNEFLFWITNKKTLSHNGYQDFRKKLQVRFVPENDIKKSFTIENEEGILVQRDQIEIGSHTCPDFVYTVVPDTWLIDDENETAESKLRTGFSKVMIISYSEGKFTNAGGAYNI